MRKSHPSKYRCEVVKNHRITARKSAYCPTVAERHSDFFHRAVNISAMDFPPDWKVDDMEDFDVAVATLAESDDSVAVELLAQLRPNGRVLDNFRFAVNSSQILDVELSFNNLLPAEPLRDYKLRYQYWARDIAIRRNLTTSGWIDVADLVAANNATVLDPTGAGIPNAEFQQILGELPDEGPEACSIRWAVVAGEDSLLKLQLQALPSDAASLNGRPITKG